MELVRRSREAGKKKQGEQMSNGWLFSLRNEEESEQLPGGTCTSKRVDDEQRDPVTDGKTVHGFSKKSGGFTPSLSGDG